MTTLDRVTTTPDPGAAGKLLAERRRDGQANTATAVCPNGHHFAPLTPEALHVAWHGPNLLCPSCVAVRLAKLGVPVFDLAPARGKGASR